MRFAVENKTELIVKYVDQKLSVNQIATEYNTYPNKVLRALKYLNIDVRDRSEATKIAIANGRKKHPTKGRKRTSAEKIKISESRAKAWDNLSEDEKLDISNRAREKWEKLPDAKKEEIRRLSTEAIQKTSKEGSSLERYLHTEIVRAGYDCYHHQKILENDKLEVDLYVASLKLAIEIDGPSHYLPIWGEDTLQQNIKSDTQKNGLVVSKGFTMIRVRCLKKTLSAKVKRDVTIALLKVIREVEQGRSGTVILLEI